MTFTAAVHTCLRKYFTFRGRGPRAEYWYFVLFTLLASVVLGIVDSALFGTPLVDTAPGSTTIAADGPLATLFNLAMVIPLLAAGWRRMHDTGRSGLYLFYPLIVMVGVGTAVAFFGGIGALEGGGALGLAAIVLIPAMIVLILSPLIVLWWLTRPSRPGPNAYGPNPYEVSQ